MQNPAPVTFPVVDMRRLNAHIDKALANPLLTRDAVLDEVQVLWGRLEPPSAQEVQGWIQSARRAKK